MARGAARNVNGKRLATQQSVNSAVKAICDIMRRSNCAGASSTGCSWRGFASSASSPSGRRASTRRPRAVGVDFHALPRAAVSLAGLGGAHRVPAVNNIRWNPTSRRRWKSRGTDVR